MLSKRVGWLCVAFTACSVYETSLIGTSRNTQRGGATSAGGSSNGALSGGGDAGESTARGGSTMGGAIASGGALDGGAGGDAEGGSAETGGSGAANGGTGGSAGATWTGGTSSGGTSMGGTTSGGKGGGASSGGTLTGGAGTTSGGAATGGFATGGTGKGGSGGATTGGTSSGGTGKGGGGGAASTGGQSGGSGGATGVLFSDNFETGNANAWTPSTSADWSVVTDGTLVYRQNTVENSLRAASVGSASWQNQAVQARVKVLSFGGTSTSSSYFVGVYARYMDENNHYYIALRSDGRMSIRRKLAGSNSSIGGAITPGELITTGKWYTVKLEVSGTTLKAYVDGVLYDTVTDTSFASGKAGLGTNNASAVFDDFVVSSL